jgi:T-complex protein 1 subunit zeta
MTLPQVLAENSGFDVQEVILDLIDEYKQNKLPVGVNCSFNENETKKTIAPAGVGVWDNYSAKKQWLHIAPTLAQ